MKKWPYKRVVSLEGNNLKVFYCLNASEIWPDNKGSLWWSGLIRGSSEIWPDNKGSL
jgi:hypothetical protein